MVEPSRDHVRGLLTGENMNLWQDWDIPFESTTPHPYDQWLLETWRGALSLAGYKIGKDKNGVQLVNRWVHTPRHQLPSCESLWRRVDLWLEVKEGGGAATATPDCWLEAGDLVIAKLLLQNRDEDWRDRDGYGQEIIVGGINEVVRSKHGMRVHYPDPHKFPLAYDWDALMPLPEHNSDWALVIEVNTTPGPPVTFTWVRTWVDKMLSLEPAFIPPY